MIHTSQCLWLHKNLNSGFRSAQRTKLLEEAELEGTRFKSLETTTNFEQNS
jgi:hypothetical protein